MLSYLSFHCNSQIQSSICHYYYLLFCFICYHVIHLNIYPASLLGVDRIRGGNASGQLAWALDRGVLGWGVNGIMLCYDYFDTLGVSLLYYLTYSPTGQLVIPSLVAANLVEDRYRFLDNLLALEAASAETLSADPSPQVLGFLSALAGMGAIPQLAARQDLGWVSQEGDHTGFQNRSAPSPVLASVGSNSQSALSLASAVDMEEVSLIPSSAVDNPLGSSQRNRLGSSV